MKTQHIIEQTKQLIRIPSTSDNPEALRDAVDFVAAIVAKYPGITIERFEQNGKPSFLAYRGKTRPKKFDILLNAHVDVVPAAPELFVPAVKDGKLCGRGALDMKGTALVLTDVFCKLVNVVPYDLGLQMVSDEEIGGYNGAKYQIEQGIRADFVVIGEYSNERNVIYNAARGICWAEITFTGKTAHGGHLWHGTNAVVKASEFAAAVLKHYPTPDQETWATTANIANLSTPNETFNKVPDSAVLKIDFRFTQEDPVFENRTSLEAFIASIDPDAKLANTSVFEPAVHVDELNPYVQGLSAALGKVTNTTVRYRKRPGSSDSRHYAAINADVIEFGLCGQRSHSDREYVELSSFDEYHAAMTAFLEEPVLKPVPINPPKGYVWFAAYGTGLDKRNIELVFNGGKPHGGNVSYPGFVDKTPPLKDTFVSLPHQLYFAGQSKMWGGGVAKLDTGPNPNAHTIAHAYLIKVSQFEELAAVQNWRTTINPLPLDEAITNGSAIIGDGSGDYDRLLYCGTKGRCPIFAFTSVKSLSPRVAPSPAYMSTLCAGLSQNKLDDIRSAFEQIITVSAQPRA